MTEIELFDSPGADVVEIVTDGDTIKPFLNVVHRVADEARIQVSDDGLRVEVVDPANVFMVDVALGADAFETYNVAQETEIGANIPALKNAVRRARKRHDDELTLSVSERELTATVARGYDNHNVVSKTEQKLIDPKTVRESPELPDLEWSVAVPVDATPLFDALGYAMDTSEHIELNAKGVNQHTDALYIGGETDTVSESVAIDGIKLSGKASAKYSTDYMAELLAGLKATDPEAVSLKFDEEYPAEFSAERDGVSMDVTYFIAPRVENDD